jgi:hypothetical protein
MDTDDLSKQTYDAIIYACDQFDHDLTIEFGVLAMACDNDDEFLDESEALIKEWLEEWELDEVIEDVFCDDPPSEKKFKEILDKLLSNIEQVRKTPIDKRTFEIW